MADGVILLSTTSLANVLGMDRTYVVRLSDQGVLPKRVDGKFDAVKTLSEYCRHLRGKLAGRVNNPKDELMRLKAVELEIRIEERLKHLIPLTSAMDAVDLLCGLYKSRLIGMPAAITRDPNLRLTLEKFVDRLLHDIADECGRAVQSLESGVDIFEDGYSEECEKPKRPTPNTTPKNLGKPGLRGPYKKSLKRLKEEGNETAY